MIQMMLKFFINIMICRNSAEFSLSRKIHSYCQRCNRTWSPLWLHWWYWSQSGPPSRAWLGLRASGSLGQTLRDWGSRACLLAQAARCWCRDWDAGVTRRALQAWVWAAAGSFTWRPGMGRRQRPTISSVGRSESRFALSLLMSESRTC